MKDFILIVCLVWLAVIFPWLWLVYIGAACAVKK